MKWQHSIPAAFLAALTIMQLAPVRAETVSINITATVYFISDGNAILNNQVHAGDTITGTYVYETTTPNNGTDPRIANYLHTSAAYGIDLSVNGLRFRTDPGNVYFQIGIAKDSTDPNFPDDYSLSSRYNLFDAQALGASSEDNYIYWRLEDRTQSTLSSVDLPATPPVISNSQSVNSLVISSRDNSVFNGANFTIGANVTSAVLSGGGGTDANGDGVDDAIGTTVPGGFATTETPPTTGSIVDDGGLDVTVTDPGPGYHGVEIRTGPLFSNPYADLDVCGFMALFYPNSITRFHCGSIHAHVIQGKVQFPADNGNVVVNLDAGAIATITRSPDGPLYVKNDGDNQAVTVTQNGNTTIVNPGPPYVVGQLVTGYFPPVDMNGIVNEVKAGSAVPLKWQITEVPAGTPVTNLASVKLKVQDVNCSLGSTTDLLEEVAPGDSGLKNLGGGSYQFNWKTPQSYANSCKKLLLDLGGGLSGPTALFSFK